MILSEQNCSSISPLLDAFHDGELVKEERATVDAHLAQCADCTGH